MLSSAEAEYMGISDACKEGIFIKNIFNELGQGETAPIVKLQNDSQSAQKISENNILNNRTKHIDIRHHFVRELIENGEVSLIYLSSEKMLADVFTKTLGKLKHEFCIQNIGLH